MPTKSKLVYLPPAQHDFEAVSYTHLLLIRKVCSVNPSVTLANAEFKITYADGTLIGDANGIFRTDEHGEIRVPGLKPGKSVIVTETRAPDGYLIDTQSQTCLLYTSRCV